MLGTSCADQSEKIRSISSSTASTISIWVTALPSAAWTSRPTRRGTMPLSSRHHNQTLHFEGLDLIITRNPAAAGGSTRRDIQQLETTLIIPWWHTAALGHPSRHSASRNILMWRSVPRHDAWPLAASSCDTWRPLASRYLLL